MRLGRSLAFSLAVAMLSAAVVVDAEQNAPALAGVWEGKLTPKAEKRAASKELGNPTLGKTTLPVVVAINVDSDGKLSGTWASAGPQGGTPIEIAVDGNTVRFTMPAAKASWEGTVSADGSTLDGKWSGKTFGGDATAPLVLRRSAQ
jgi:hypothetical protein